MTTKRTIDKIDRIILDTVKHNGRVSNLELSKQIELVPSATLERTRRLENDGIIQGYYAKIDSSALGKSLRAFVHVTVNATNWSDQTKESIKAIEDVTEVHEIAGDASYIVKIETKDTNSLSIILKEEIGSIPEILSTRSSIVLSSETNLH